MPIARNGIESNRIYRTDDENSNHASSTAAPQAQASTGQFGIQQRQRQLHTLSFNQQLQPILDMTPDSTRPTISSHYPRAPFLSSTFGSAHFNPSNILIWICPLHQTQWWMMPPIFPTIPLTMPLPMSHIYPTVSVLRPCPISTQPVLANTSTRTAIDENRNSIASNFE